MNNYAVSSDGIATALQDSASALMEAGNNLEQSVALVAAANKVVQDPNSVGSALRTISLRLRGTSVSVLEEMGEETDGVVESVSKMQKKIQALTGVNILTDSGAYKETYTILKEIGTVWEDMSDIDQAALLELMAGKNRANTLAAILGNMEDLEGAYESALNAEGSALKENEAYLNSIQGRIDLFNNAVQTMWMNLLDTSATKGIVDLGTDLIKLLDTTHGKILGIVGALMLYQKIKYKTKFSEMFTGAVDILKSVYTSIVSMTAATNSLTKADIARAWASQGVEKSLITRIIAETGLGKVTGALTKEQIKATAATLGQALANGELTASQYLAAMSSMGLKTALQGLWTVLKANPIIAIAAVVAAAALAFDHFHTTAQEAADAAKEAFDEIQSVLDATKSTIQELESELATLQDQINGFDGKLPSFADNEELKRLKEKREELEHSLKIQQQLLELQQEASNKQAVASMKAYTKAASEGAEKTQETAKTWGTIAGVVGGALLTIGGLALIPVSGGTSSALSAMGTSTLVTSIGAGAVAGGIAGNKAGEAIGSGVAANDGTYDSWYETYTKALDAAREDEQKALKKYQKDSSNIDKLDKWQEAQRRTTEIETEMYDHLTQMQQYYAGLEYGDDEEINAELDKWYNFLDKLSISEKASGAKTTALDRIFGENASEDIQNIKTQILDAVDAGKNFDFDTAINESQELKNILDYVGISADDVKNYFTQIGEEASAVVKDITPVQTYSELLEDAEKYKEILLQTSEIVVDNTKVTEDYKESLVALVGSEAEVNKYFDKNNKLIVKDAKGLNNLIKAAKKNTAQNAQLAKSQAKLQYYELYKKMRNCVKAEGLVVAGKKQEILALYEEMNVLEKVIAKYSRLEAQLLSTNNSYNQFDAAQEADSATDYIGSVETWITALGEAFNTAELGTETAQVAIAGLVPESVYKDLDTVDEKMSAIYGYFKTGKLAQYFDIKFDEDGAIESAEMKLGNLRKFIEDGLANGTFVGSDWKHFDLSEDINSLEEFKNAMGVTEEVAFAFIESFEDHDIEWLDGDYSSMFEDILPHNLANDIYENTEALADLAVQLANGEITAEEYTDQWNKLSQASQENAQKARENATAWIETSNDVEAAKEKVQKLADELDTLYEQGASESEINIKTEELKTAEQDLTQMVEKLAELEDIDAVVLQVALDQAQAEIDAFEKENSTLLTKVEIVQDKESGEYEYRTKDGATLSDGEKQKLTTYLEDVNAKFMYENELGKEVVPYEDQLQDIEQILQNIYDKIDGGKENYAPSNENRTTPEASTMVAEEPSKFKQFFAETLPQEWDEFWNNVGTFLTGLGEEADILKKKIISFFKETVVGFVTETIPNAFTSAFEVIKNFFIETVPATMDGVKTSISEFFNDTLPEVWRDFWSWISDGVVDLIESATNGLDKFSKALDNFLDNTLPKAWNDFWSSVGDFVFETIPYTIGYIKGASERFWNETVPKAWDTFVENVKEGWSNLVESAKTFINNTLDSLKQGVDNLIQSIDKFVYETWPSIKESVLEYWSNLKKSIIEAFSDVVEGVKEFIFVTIPETYESVKGYFKDLLDTVKSETQGMVNSVLEFINITIPTKIEEMKTSIGDFLSGIITSVGNFLSNILTWIPDKISTMWSNFTAGLGAGSSGGKYSPQSGPQNVNGTVHNGKAHASGSCSLPTSEHNSLVGELGPEMVVDPSTGRYYTVGDAGAEMVDLPKGAIIFNHKQTESLLKNGYVASRGKAYAEGNAHVTIWPDASSKVQWDGTGYSGPDDPTWDPTDALDDMTDSISNAADSANEFAESLDWIEIRIEELDETIGKLSAELENAVGYAAKNNKIDQIIAKNKEKRKTVADGANYYEEYAQKYYAKIDSQYQDFAKNGAIAITDFAGEASEATVEAIQKYRDYIQKAADLRQQEEELLTEIRDLAIQRIDNAHEHYSVRATVESSQTEKLQNAVDYDEERGLITNPEYYAAMMENSSKTIEYLTKARKAMQEELDEAVRNGEVIRGSNEWYELLDKMYQVDAEIDGATKELEEFQNAINDIYWENFDQLINRLDYISEETQGLVDLMSTMDMVSKPDNEDGWSTDDVKWTKEGLATLGLHAQEMERAEEKAKMYAKAIDDLTVEYKAGHYSESEYHEKLNELTQGQYDAIQAAQDEKEAIVELNEARVDAIKEGIEKQVEAYEKLIKKQKEELDSEKDLYDFQRSTMEQQKNIADIERKLAALANDNSMSAIAKRKQLEQELAEAQYELQDTYYNRSVEDKQTALDKELENFQTEKEAEIEKWEEYLTNVEAIVTESLGIVKSNADEIGATLTEKTEEYNLTVSDAVLNPWKDGALAIDEYTTKFGDTISSTTEQLGALKDKWAEIRAELEKANEEADKYYNKEMAIAKSQSVADINAENERYANTTKAETTVTNNKPTNNNTNSNQSNNITVGGKINAGSARIYANSNGAGGGKQYFASDPIYTVLQEKNGYLLVRHHKSSSGATGWFKKSDVKAYAKGTTGADKDQWAILDELGDELQLIPGKNGRLEYVKKGTGIVPADMTANLMSWGQLDPQDMLDRNRPTIGASHVVHNEVNITMDIAEVVHIDHVDHDTLPDLTKAVRKEMDSYMLKVNNAIKAKVR